MDIDRHYKEICKERGIDLTAQPEQAVPQQPAEEMPDTPSPSTEAQKALLLVMKPPIFMFSPATHRLGLHTLTMPPPGSSWTAANWMRRSLPLSTAALKICEMHDMGGQPIQYAPLSMIETLQEAAVQQMRQRPRPPPRKPPCCRMPGTPSGRISHAGPYADPGRFGKVRLSGRGPSAPFPKSGPTS